MGLLTIVAVLLLISTLFGVFNYHVLKLPQAIGLMTISLLSSIGILFLDRFAPGLGIGGMARAFVESFEFSTTLLEGMLGLLLFAGALHVSVNEIKKHASVIFLVASLGVVISTAIIGSVMSLYVGMPIMVAMVLGVICSPTDPVAVIGILRQANLSKSLETQVAGESLFNDGVAYVLFLILVSIAFPAAHAAHGAGHGAEGDVIVGGIKLFLQEALGGAALGFGLGWIAFAMMKRIDDFALEIMITLTLAFGGYVLSLYLHVSAPIMAVVSGLLIGHVGMRDGMSETTRSYVDAFWKVLDEILNAALFVAIGFEVLVLTITKDFILAGLVTAGVGVAARGVAVAIPMVLARKASAPVIGLLTWGGLKGGISIALALSLPESEWKPMILTVTYVVVICSILFQGLTIGRAARKLFPTAPDDAGGAHEQGSAPTAANS